ncbi:hypothetical protein PBCVAN69C_430L [Paramecium bursaria Chlorella virus AN69C]|uniref:DUF5874 domain-containing protein n=1 Tax=Paramecium bursaria Chlorella virus IL3A TaxID=46019 RepID=M1HUM9_PBCVI|nr:hypothetical protein PBCVAN69C_430L [Paramecium bursaria Chlorella virus AN69C]AGE53899.1 hypothetical protein PBCVIL3A_424L [Paramecium bursaria Chlorella virus IL3A]AGE57327.1 hypothetical protein PBCVNEJV4_426L [Paramecium bursaria Chlorella virus NE-JV-4]
MNNKMLLLGLAIIAVVVIAVMYFKKDTKCVCPSVEEAIEEGYEIGLADGINAVDDDDTDVTETFYDYEYDKGGKKYEEKTGSKFVKKVGGQCPPRTKEVKSGKHKGKCEKSMSWYKTYRGKDSSGKTFTCTGGRVSYNGNCVCDTKSGKTWNGSKCVCDKSRGLKWDSKTKRCRNKQDGRTASTPVLKYNPKPKPSSKPSSKPASQSCPRFQKWNGSKCECDYSQGVAWNGKDCVCDTSKGFEWNGTKCVNKWNSWDRKKW